MDDAVTLAARVLAGLLCGVYVAFAVGVMPALRQVDDRTFVEVMQRINVVIVNPAFVLVFLGARALALGTGVLDRSPLGWVAWNALRTMTGLASLVCLLALRP